MITWCMMILIILCGFVYGQLPNLVGIAFGTIQMVLYAVYRNHKPPKDQKLPENKGDIENGGVITTVTTVDERQLVMISQPSGHINMGEKMEEIDLQNQTQQNNKSNTEGGEREISSRV